MKIPELDIPGEGSVPSGPRVEVGDRDSSCYVLVAAPYPRQQLVDGVEGWVEVHFSVLADGSISDALVADSDPPRVFDNAALRSVYRWRCQPGVSDGVAVSRRVSRIIRFRIEQ